LHVRSTYVEHTALIWNGFIRISLRICTPSKLLHYTATPSPTR